MMGEATIKKMDGVDVYLAMYGCLPPEHFTQSEAKQYGWIYFKGNLHEVLPSATIGGDIYQNRNGKLPDAHGASGMKPISIIWEVIGECPA